jgi:hypothetical protein
VKEVYPETAKRRLVWGQQPERLTARQSGDHNASTGLNAAGAATVLVAWSDAHFGAQTDHRCLNVPAKVSTA